MEGIKGSVFCQLEVIKQNSCLNFCNQLLRERYKFINRSTKCFLPASFWFSSPNTISPFFRSISTSSGRFPTTLYELFHTPPPLHAHVCSNLPSSFTGAVFILTRDPFRERDGTSLCFLASNSKRLPRFALRKGGIV